MRLNLKFVAIFIIAIYCLSPLAAVDFSHDNTNGTDDSDKSINMDDNEKTIKNDTDDSKDSKDSVDYSKNSKEDKQNTVAKNQTKDRNAKGASTFNLEVTADDYAQGSEGTLRITHNNTNSIDAKCEIKGDNYEDTKTVKLSADQKVTEAKLSKNLKPGNYAVKVYYEGDSDYQPVEASTTFKVTGLGKNNANLTVSAVSDKPGTVNVDVNANSQLSGKVNVTLNGTDTVKWLNVVKGHGQVTIKNVASGNYTVTANFGGNDDFDSASATTTVSVQDDRLDPNLSIDVKPVRVGDKAVAEIHADKSFNGNVTLHLNQYGDDFDVELKNGYASYTIDWNFPIRHDNQVSVIFDGDDTYKAGQASTIFEVYPADKFDPDLKVHVNDIYIDDEDIVVNVTANENFTGDVDIIYDQDYGKLYKLHLENGKGSITSSTLAILLGKHSFTAHVASTEEHIESEDTEYFYCRLHDSNITVNVNDTMVGDEAHFVFTGTDRASGYVVLQINGTTDHSADAAYTLYMTRGELEWDISGLPAGNYTVSASFKANNLYDSSEAQTTFNVNKYPLNLNLKADHIVENQQSFVEINCDKSFTGDVKLKINDTERTVQVRNGWDMEPIGKLSQGKYNASVSFEGDDKYLPDQDSKTFIVYPSAAKDSGLKMWFEDKESYDGEIVRLKISAYQEFNETVQVKLDDGRVLDVHLEDGKEVTEKLSFGPGQHTATINYEGNGTFKPCDISTDLLVKEKLDSNITATVKNISHGEKAVVEFHADPKFIGPLYIQLNDHLLQDTVYIENGYGNITFDDLDAGNYVVSYEFKGDGEYKDCKGSVSFNVAAIYDPNLDIVVDDVTYGQDAVAYVHANETLSGNASITLNGSDAVYPVEISEGYGSTTLKDLRAGNYTATVSYDGDNTTFRPGSNSTTFQVKKIPTEISVDVDNVTEGDSAVAYIHLNQQLSGGVKVKLDDGRSKIVMLTNGDGNITFNNLTHGNHTVKATFEGNNIYDKAENSKIFSVNKNDPKLDVSVDSVKIGQDAKVLITTDKSYTGKVDVQIGSNASSVDIEEGQAEITLKDLKVGNYTVKAKINESSTFKYDEKTVNFSVSKYNPDLDIKVEDTFLHYTAKAVVTTNKTFSGNVKIEVEGIIYDANVTNGEGSVELNALPEGSHEAKATFEETALFEAAEKTTTFNIFKFDPDLNVKVDNITLGEDAHVEITANSFITDTVLVEIGVATYKVNITNGYGSLDVPGLKVGDYDVKVVYKGDDWFSPANKTAHFSVNKFDPNLDVRVSNINVGEDANVAVTTAKDFSGNVKVQVADKNYNVTVTDGQGSVKVSGLAAGNYNVKVTFEETAKYKASEKTATFSVNKFDPNLKVSVSSVRQSEKPVVTVTTDSKFSGNVNVKVDSTNYVVSVANGKGTKTISSLKKGTHKATATLAETQMFKSATKSVSFNVKADTVKLVLKKTKIKKSAKKATLQATLKINGKAVKGKVVKFTFKGKTYKAKTNAMGIAKVTLKKSVLKKLKVGKKVTYKAIYSPKTVKKTVKVLK